jgi:hypothetical protein
MTREFKLGQYQTLGEYRRLCAAIGGDDCAAVKLLDRHISRSPHGADEKVIKSDSNMRYLLMPLLITTELPTGGRP